VRTCSPIDTARFESFTAGDPELERELGALFLTTAAHLLDRLRRSLGSPGDWRDAAHALKGASSNIGAPLLAELAERAERLDGSPALLAELEAQLARVQAFFEERLPRAGRGGLSSRKRRLSS
jgi:HPt (histidine-containing phosphotransfer) domain-containing protein